MNPNNPVSTETLLEKNEPLIDWQPLWRVIQMRRWVILTAVSLALFSTTLEQLRLPDIYTAETSLLLENAPNTALSFKELLFASQGPYSYYGTQIALLKSRSTLDEVIRSLDLEASYTKRSETPFPKEALYGILRGKIQTEIERNTDILRISVRDPEPEMAAKITNALAEAFVKESWRQRFFVSHQLLTRFSDNAEAVQRNDPLSGRLEKEEMIGLLPSVANDPIISGFKQEQMKLTEESRQLSLRYTEAHPKMQELRRKLAGLETELKIQTEKVVTGLKAGLAGEFSVNPIRILEPASIPRGPSGPQRLHTVLMNTLIATFLTIGILVLWEQLNRNIRNEEDVRRISLPFLGYLPVIPGMDQGSKKESPKSLFDLIKADTSLVDTVNNIRVSILFSMPAERGRLLLCTSALPEEGKTTFITMLGICLAESGEKVLLIDADMRKPSLHSALQLENREGLSNCLVGTTSARQAIQILEDIPNLHVLTAGERTPNPVILLGASAMDRLIQELSVEYDRILFDAPPALHMADALVLAEKVDATILIFQSDKIHLSVGKKLAEKIQSAKGLTIGAVINRVDYQKLDHPYYQFYRSYSKYYSSSSKV